MKFIELKKLGTDLETLNRRLQAGEITQGEAEAELARNGAPADYRVLIGAIVNRVDPQKGIDYGQMKRRFRIADALEAAEGGVLALEDEDHRLLADLAQMHPWGIVDRNLAQLVEDIRNAAGEAAVPR
ncbi:hypothetical protein HPQ64_12455 [Rhizobiales bacterium]|uniref:hypothetical protein n=1 Tax=Hongsoonwoonella zoysiae TaxID=2821844 RepID=UPI001560022E|nr:hypothetical protein [Hongsoonwoonella zoysiae]NRG18501.1 hypothetical protein [Hongsoonwoonella zoysiae]